MSAVTLAELRKELERFPTKIELHEQFATKLELREELERFSTKLELREELERFATKVDLELWGGAIVEMFKGMEQRMFDELARHARAIQTRGRDELSAVDEKCTDLPPRVTRLESKVFAPKRDRRR